MPILKRNAENPKIDERIDELLTELEPLTGDDPAYEKTLKQIQKLHKLKDNQSKNRVSADTALLTGSNVLIAAMLIAFEKNHVISSKFQGFLTKLR